MTKGRFVVRIPTDRHSVTHARGRKGVQFGPRDRWHGARSEDARLRPEQYIVFAGRSCLVLLLAGCAPSLTTMAPARVVPEHHVQITTSGEVTETNGPVRDAIEAIEDIDGRGRMTPAEIRVAARGAASALVQPPSIGYQISVSYSPIERLEIGLRSSMSAVRGHVRFQFLKIAPGFYGVAGVGVSGYLYGFPLQTFTSAAETLGYARWDFDFPIHVGYSNRYFHAWAGPKLVLSTYDAEFEACVDETRGRCDQSATIGLTGTAAYVTGQLGLAVGYRQFWVAAELTIGRVGLDSELAIDDGPRAETLAFESEGLVLSPALGIIVWF